MQIRISGVMPESVVDGPGVRMVVFMQGCPHRCPGCHNPHTHDPAGGEWVDTEDILNRFKANPLLSGLTISGGEPLLQAAAAACLARGVKELNKSVLLYSGYTLEELQSLSRENEDIAHLLAHTDTLIDGPYIEAERDISLAFRGSRNQRIIELVSKQIPPG